MRNRSLIILVAVCSVSSLTWASSGFGDASTSTTETGTTPAAVAAREHVAALRQPAAPANDTVASEVADGPLLSDDPVDLASARMVRGVGRAVWLAISSDGQSVCEVTSGALACPPVSEVVEKGLSPVLVTRAGEPVHVSGVASDAVGSVDVVLADGSVETVEVSDNYFAIDLPDVPRALRWTGPGGAETFRFPEL
jgi:hypothetical protein